MSLQRLSRTPKCEGTYFPSCFSIKKATQAPFEQYFPSCLNIKKATQAPSRLSIYQKRSDPPEACLLFIVLKVNPVPHLHQTELPKMLWPPGELARRDSQRPSGVIRCNCQWGNRPVAQLDCERLGQYIRLLSSFQNHQRRI